MKRRILSTVIAGIIVVGTLTSTIQVSATPSNQEVQQQRDEYEKKKAKVSEVNEKIQGFDNQISELTVKIDDNNKQIGNINKEVENTDKEIEQVKADIANKEELLGKRLREIYKSGGEADYISLVFSADSLSDLITKVSTAAKLVNTDQKVVKDLSDSKVKLDEKVSSLGTKANEVQSLNNDIQTQKDQLNQKKQEQEQVRVQAKAEEEQFYNQFLVPIEREQVKGFIDVANNPNSSESQLKDAVNALKAFKPQLKSGEVEKEVNDAIENAEKTLKGIQDRKVAPVVNRGGSSNTGGNSSSDSSNDSSISWSGDKSAIVNYAYQFIGRPYVWGATGPNSFDCSGFTSYVYRNVAGINIGRTTYDQINAGREVSRDELQPGDLVFPHDGHVTIYIGNGQVIHAPQTGDVIKISPIWKFWRARRIIG